MATEEQKKIRQVKLFNEVIYGLAKGMWDLFGEGSYATVTEVGEGIVEGMERDLGLEIQGEAPQDILTELGRIYVDEVGGSKLADFKIKDDRIDIIIEDCILLHTSRELQKSGIQPFTCIPMMIAAAALRERLGLKAQVGNIAIEGNKCVISFVMA